MKKENIEKLLKGAESVMIVTDNGLGIEGNLASTLRNLSLLISKLRETIPKDLLDYAIQLGLRETKKSNEEKDKKVEELRKELQDSMKKIIKSIVDNLKDLSGDDKNE